MCQLILHLCVTEFAIEKRLLDERIDNNGFLQRGISYAWLVIFDLATTTSGVRMAGIVNDWRFPCVAVS